MTQWDMGESEFEWDEGKAEANARKHGMTFEWATGAFKDPYALNRTAKDGRSGEKRRRATGAIGDTGTIVSVIYTMRGNGKTIRLISARPASEGERRECAHSKAQGK